MTLKARITEDMKTRCARRTPRACRPSACCSPRSSSARSTSASELADADVLAIIDKMVKQRRDSIAQFEAGKRADLVAVEQAELDVLAGLPAAAADRRRDRRR